MSGFAPLRGLYVLDLTTSLAGPYCTWILAALGADVVKVERPDGGDDTRTWGPPFWNGESATFLALNAGKRSLALDVKHPDGLAAMRRLARRADVFVQNLRPRLVERLGLGFEDLRRENERLVYCAIGAFGKRGLLKDHPGYDPVMQAAAGIMSMTGEPGRPPARAGASIVDQGTGMWAAVGVLAALRARDAGAGAQLVETSLYESAVNLVPYQLLGTLATGVAPGPLGSAIGIIAPYQAFATSDGWLMVAAGNDRIFRSLCAVMGLPELADDPRFRGNPDRVANRRALVDLLAERFARDETAAWLSRLAAAGVPAAPVHDLSDVLASEQTAALGLLQPLPRDDIPDLRLVAPPVSVGDERLPLRLPPPALGEHSRAVLAEVGYAEKEIDALARDGVVGAER